MDREELERRRFTQDEVGELIETASRLDHLTTENGLSFQELRRVATELGISDKALLEAVARELDAERAAREKEAAAQEAEEKKRKRRRKTLNEWKSHLTSYIAVIGGLAAIDWFSGGGLDWFFYPAAGWGIGLVIHTLNVLFRVDT